jgi:glutamate/tyrosine decarboxylase-like PLP-dependent enzyme
MQNTRGFRALKVWLGLQQAGKNGYINMIGEDIELAAYIAEVIRPHKELELFTNSLSITTFRYVPAKYADNKEQCQEDLNEINTKLLENLQKEGKVYLSNAVIDGNFLLRACIVNFRTTKADIEALPGIVLEVGRRLPIN